MLSQSLDLVDSVRLLQPQFWPPFKDIASSATVTPCKANEGGEGLLDIGTAPQPAAQYISTFNLDRLETKVEHLTSFIDSCERLCESGSNYLTVWYLYPFKKLNRSFNGLIHIFEAVVEIP